MGEKGTMEGDILAERVTLAQCSAYCKSYKTTDCQATNKAETRDSGSNVDIPPPTFQSRVMFD